MKLKAKLNIMSMFNLSETAKISCHYESFTIAGAIFRENGPN